MAYPSQYADSSISAVRRYFGLTLEALGQYLGVDSTLLAHIEARRREPSATVLRRLLPLADQVPPAPVEAPATPPPVPAAPPEAEPLRRRLAQCEQQAGRLRRELGQLRDELRVARRWQQALPALLAAEPLQPTPAETERLPLVRRWLQRRGEDAATTLTGTRATRFHLLTARLAALEAETAALAQALALEPEKGG
ncbi:hypothetical protein [Hymenobacter sp. B81]|uniref:hypothetical protein n=1 Tax=Hymenobacter sp. B81 TaxID=3344878 RepID=UPI0037DCC5FE